MSWPSVYVHSIGFIWVPTNLELVGKAFLNSCDFLLISVSYPIRRVRSHISRSVCSLLQFVYIVCVTDKARLLSANDKILIKSM
jgi:hypothetical protein